MQYRNLGRSGLKISPLCLGTMMFGGPTDEATAGRIVGSAREAGITFIDTADVYTDGRSEEITGRAIKAERDGLVLATKLANPTGEGPNDAASRASTWSRPPRTACGGSGRTFIDITYLHKEDHTTPLAETVRALADLVRAGKIRHFGVSNHRSWRIAEICRLCDEAGIDRPVVSQPYYNAFNRMPETEHLPACAHFGLGVVPYSPLARGVLTGKYDPDAPPPEDSRAGRQDKRMMQTEWRPESLRIARTFRAHAEARGITAGQFATAWVLNNRLITGVIAGPRTEAQWQEYLGALDYAFTPEDEALVDRPGPAQAIRLDARLQRPGLSAGGAASAQRLRISQGVRSSLARRRSATIQRCNSSDGSRKAAVRSGPHRVRSFFWPRPPSDARPRQITRSTPMSSEPEADLNEKRLVRENGVRRARRAGGRGSPPGARLPAGAGEGSRRRTAAPCRSWSSARTARSPSPGLRGGEPGDLADPRPGGPGGQRLPPRTVLAGDRPAAGAAVGLRPLGRLRGQGRAEPAAGRAQALPRDHRRARSGRPHGPDRSPRREGGIAEPDLATVARSRRGHTSSSPTS